MQEGILSHRKRNFIMLNSLIKPKDVLPDWSMPATPAPEKLRLENNRL